MSLLTGILMSGNNRKFDLEISAINNVLPGGSFWLSEWTNSTYLRQIQLDSVGSILQSDTEIFPAKGGANVSVRINKLFIGVDAATTINFLKNSIVQASVNYSTGQFVDYIHVFTGLAADDVIAVEIIEGP